MEAYVLVNKNKFMLVVLEFTIVIYLLVHNIFVVPVKLVTSNRHKPAQHTQCYFLIVVKLARLACARGNLIGKSRFWNLNWNSGLFPSAFAWWLPKRESARGTLGRERKRENLASFSSNYCTLCFPFLPDLP